MLVLRKFRHLITAAIAVGVLGGLVYSTSSPSFVGDTSKAVTDYLSQFAFWADEQRQEKTPNVGASIKQQELLNTATVSGTVPHEGELQTSSTAKPLMRARPPAGGLPAYLSSEESIGPAVRQVRPAAPQPAVAAVASSDQIRQLPLTAIAETIHIRFQGFDKLTGTYRLNEDETISIAGVGRISIADTTAAELEATLGKHILEQTGRHAPVSIEVSTYRHVFVSGDVDKPGSFRWQRGLTVVKAISLSGGIYRPKTTSVFGAGPTARRGTLDIARLKLAQTLIRHARLKAEINGEKLLRTPERLIGIFGRNQANQLTVDEQEILDTRNKTKASLLASLNGQLESAGVEIERLEDLERAMDKRRTSYGRLVRNLRRAHRAKRVSNQRFYEAEARFADIEEKLASTKVQLVRARSAKQRLEAQTTQLTEGRRDKLIEERIKTEADIERLQIEYEMVREANDDIDTTPTDRESDGGEEAQSKSISYTIIRGRRGGGEQRLDARRLDALLPGDTLVVRRLSSLDLAPTSNHPVRKGAIQPNAGGVQAAKAE